MKTWVQCVLLQCTIRTFNYSQTCPKRFEWEKVSVFQTYLRWMKVHRSFLYYFLQYLVTILHSDPYTMYVSRYDGRFRQVSLFLTVYYQRCKWIGQCTCNIILSFPYNIVCETRIQQNWIRQNILLNTKLRITTLKIYF